MSGVLPAPPSTQSSSSNLPSAGTPQQPAPTAAAGAATTLRSTTPKPSTDKVASRPSLPQLKRTPSFSVKSAMEGKVPPTTPTSTQQGTLGATSNGTAGNIGDLEEEEEILDTEIIEVELTQKNLEQAWSKYADYIKPSRPRIYHTLMSTKPTLLNDTSISFDVMNTLQKDDLMNVFNELISYLRRSLGSPLLELEFNVAEFESTNAKPYTLEDKFKHMIQKNPAVLTLKQVLGLDFD